MMKSYYLLLTLFLGWCTASGFAQGLHRLSIKNEQALQAFFKYTGADIPLISGHRGCHHAQYPENSIEAFEYVLSQTPAFFEIDPRLTKDSVIVLLHDATLDRTTNGTGRVSDHTWAELRQLRLKDHQGNLTPYRIPTLEEAIGWARGKTILNLDKKDVPLEMTEAMIEKLNAGSFVMVTVHDARQARFYYDKDPNRMMSAFVKTEQALGEYEAAGVPWSNMIAYIGPENKKENDRLLQLLHERGVMCMISAAPIYDKLGSSGERAAAYRQTFTMGADILESDWPVEAARAIQTMLPRRSRKEVFFKWDGRLPEGAP